MTLYSSDAAFEANELVQFIGDVPDSGDIPLPRAGAAAVYWQDKVIVFGGLGLTAFYNDVYALDVPSLSWSQWTCHGAVPTPRGSSGSSLLLGDCLTLFGGRTQEGLTNEIMLLDLRKRRWSVGKTIGGRAPVSREDCCALRHDEATKLLVYGGSDESGAILTDLWTYSLESALWTQIQYSGDAPPHGLSAAVGCSLTPFHALIVGGNDGHAFQCDAYLLDLGGFVWRRMEMTTLPRPRTHFVLCPMSETRALLFGGYSGALALQDVWVCSIEESPFVVQSGSARPRGHWTPIVLHSKPGATIQTVSARGAPAYCMSPHDGTIWILGGCNGYQFLSSLTTIQVDLLAVRKVEPLQPVAHSVPRQAAASTMPHDEERHSRLDVGQHGTTLMDTHRLSIAADLGAEELHEALQELRATVVSHPSTNGYQESPKPSSSVLHQLARPDRYASIPEDVPVGQQAAVGASPKARGGFVADQEALMERNRVLERENQLLRQELAELRSYVQSIQGDHLELEDNRPSRAVTPRRVKKRIWWY